MLRSARRARLEARTAVLELIFSALTDFVTASFAGGDEPFCRSFSFTASEGGPAVGRGSGRAFELVGTNKKVGRNFPRLADLVDHLDSQRPPAGKDFRGARA